MLKTIRLYNLISVLVVALVSTPVLVQTSHDHFVPGGDGCHSIQSHTCNTNELHRALRAGDTCLSCLRAGHLVALFPANHRRSAIAPLGATTLVANPQFAESDDLTRPQRGPPIVRP